jgi:hypothetical protein
LLDLFDPEDGGDVPSKHQLTFNGLHGVISQKIVLFITTAVRTSNPTRNKKLVLNEDGVRWAPAFEDVSPGASTVGRRCPAAR